MLPEQGVQYLCKDLGRRAEQHDADVGNACTWVHLQSAISCGCMLHVTQHSDKNLWLHADVTTATVTVCGVLATWRLQGAVTIKVQQSPVQRIAV